MSEIREKLANLCHEQWSGWMQYLFSKCEKNVDGTMTMPQWAVERWVRQMQTPYADLSGAEQDSDRTEADKFLGLCGSENAALRERIKGLKRDLEEILELLGHTNCLGKAQDVTIKALRSIGESEVLK